MPDIKNKIENMDRVFCQEIDMKKLDTILDSKAIFSSKDLNTSIFLLKLKIDNNYINLTDCDCYVNILKPDNHKVKQFCEIVTPEEGLIAIQLNEQAVAIGGTYNYEVNIVNSKLNKKTVSPKIIYKVGEAFDDGDITSVDSYDVLVDLLAKVKNVSQDEDKRKLQETNRINAETERLQNENTRKEAETNRVNKETERQNSETNRISAETERIEAENTRKQNETTRQNNESSRVQAENSRKAAEDVRNRQEDVRQSNEVTRNSEEASRITAETARQNAENTRNSNETTRQTAENSRLQNETTRQSNETSRQQNFENMQSTVTNSINTLNSKFDATTGQVTGNISSLSQLIQNANDVKSQVEQKIQDAQNKADELNIDEMKNNINNIQNSLLTGQYTSYSGTNLTCNDTLSSKTSNMVIKGQTYQNLVNGSPYYAGANTSLFHWELSENDSKITIKRTQTGDINWQYVGVPININLLKNNTTYTVIFFASGKCECVNAYINIMEGSAINSVGGKNISRISGVNKCKFTTDHNTKIQNQILYIGIDRSELPNVNDYMTLSNFVLLEGDWTNKEMPSSITGIESVGEKENNKISILSHNKNLFNVNNENISYSIMKTTITDNTIKIEPVSSAPWASVNIKVDGLKKGVSYEITCEKEKYHLEDDKIAIFQDQGNICVGTLRDKPFTVQENIDTDDLYLRIHCSDESSNTETVILKDIMIHEASTTGKFVTQKIDKKEILLPFENGLKSLPNGVADTIEQREDGVYLVQRVGKIDLANANYSVSVDSEAGLIVRTKINNIKQLTIDNYICNILVGICNAWDFDYWKDWGFPIAINTENMKNQGQNGIEILVQKTQITSITDVVSFKKYLQDNSAVIYYELETPIETKLDTKDVNVETFDDLTYILTNNNIQPELEFKIPSNLGALIQNNAKKINELFKLIDELIIPQLTTNTSDIAMLQITK